MSSPNNIHFTFNVWKTLSFILIVTAIAYSPFILDDTLSPRFILTALFLLAFFYVMWREKKSMTINFTILSIAYLLFVFWTCLTSFFSINPGVSYFENGKLILGLGMFFISSYFLEQHFEKFLRSVFSSAIIISIILAVVIIWQASALKSFDHENLYAISGLNGHKNLASSFLFLMLCFLFMAYFKESGMMKKYASVGICINIILILFLRTKAVWLAFIFSAFVFVTVFILRFIFNKFIKTKQPILSIAFLFIAVNVFFIFLLNPICYKLIQNNATPKLLNKIISPLMDIERLTVWQKTYAITNSPFIGIGSGNWQIYFPSVGLSGLWRAEDLGVSFQRPHNDFLWIMRESGLIGFNLYLIFLIGLIVYGFNKYVAGNAKSISIQHVALYFLLGFLCISFFDFPKERIEHIIWLNILLAFLHHDVKSNLPLKIQLKSRAKQFGIFILLSAGLVYIGFLRFRGEYFTREMYNAKNQANAFKIIQHGLSARSFAYHLDPTSVPIEWYIGNAYSNQKNYFMANNYFKLAYKQNPYQRNVLNDLASSDAMLGNTEAAISMYTEAARISPRFDEPKLNLASIHINQNNIIAAKQCLDSIFHDSERRSRYYEIIKIIEKQRQ